MTASTTGTNTSTLNPFVAIPDFTELEEIRKIEEMIPFIDSLGVDCTYAPMTPGKRNRRGKK